MSNTFGSLPWRLQQATNISDRMRIVADWLEDLREVAAAEKIRDELPFVYDEEDANRSYDEGYEDGFEAGRDEGYKDAWEEAEEAFERKHGGEAQDVLS